VERCDAPRLAREWMMAEVADAYMSTREQMISNTPALWKEINAKIPR
jgi:hypothetical protein